MYFQILPDEARVVTPSQARLNAFAARHLEIRMFHVGHGECILVVFPNDNCWLVDCGSGTRSGSNEALARNVVNYLVSNGLQLDAIVAPPNSSRSEPSEAISLTLCCHAPLIRSQTAAEPWRSFPSMLSRRAPAIAY